MSLHMKRFSSPILIAVFCFMLTVMVTVGSFAAAQTSQSVSPLPPLATAANASRISGSLSVLSREVRLDRAVSLKLELVNSGLSTAQVAVTVPQASGLRNSTPLPPNQETPTAVLAPGANTELVLAWVPTVEGVVTAAVDVWVTPADAKATGVTNAGTTTIGTATTGGSNLQSPMNWTYLARYTAQVRVYPLNAPKIGIDKAHANKSAGLAAVDILGGGDVVLQELETGWSDASVNDLSVLWVEVPLATSVLLFSRFSPEELAIAGRFVTNGGALVVLGSATPATFQDGTTQVNELLAAVGAKTRVVGSSVTSPNQVTLATVAVAQMQAGFLPLQLQNASPLLVSGATTSLLQGVADDQAPVVFGALERVGLGWVAVIGASLSAVTNDNLRSTDNQAFAVALASWLAEQSVQRKLTRK